MMNDSPFDVLEKVAADVHNGLAQLRSGQSGESAGDALVQRVEQTVVDAFAVVRPLKQKSLNVASMRDVMPSFRACASLQEQRLRSLEQQLQQFGFVTREGMIENMKQEAIAAEEERVLAHAEQDQENTPPEQADEEAYEATDDYALYKDPEANPTPRVVSTSKTPQSASARSRSPVTDDAGARVTNAATSSSRLSTPMQPKVEEEDPLKTPTLDDFGLEAKYNRNKDAVVISTPKDLRLDEDAAVAFGTAKSQRITQTTYDADSSIDLSHSPSFVRKHNLRSAKKLADRDQELMGSPPRSIVRAMQFDDGTADLRSLGRAGSSTDILANMSTSPGMPSPPSSTTMKQWEARARPSAAPEEKRVQGTGTASSVSHITESEYAATPSFLHSQMPLDIANANIDRLNSFLRSVGPEKTFTLDQLRDDIDLGSKSKAFVLVLMKAHKVTLSGSGGQTYAPLG